MPIGRSDFGPDPSPAEEAAPTRVKLPVVSRGGPEEGPAEPSHRVSTPASTVQSGAFDRGTTRRGLLGALFSSLAALFAIGSRPGRALSRTTALAAGRQSPGFYIGDVEEVPAGGAIRADYRGQPMIVLEVEGEFRVFSAICLHEGCIVDWNRDLALVQCPCHDGRYDREGKVVAGPPPAALVRYESRVVEGKIFVVEG